VTDTQDKPNLPDNPPRFDELLTTIRAALAQDAGADARSAGGIACRAILGALDPTSRPGMPFTPLPTAAAGASSTQPPTSSVSASPIAALLGAIGAVPREQLVDVIGSLRWLFGPPAPAYLTRPTPPRSQGVVP
jgi:hypothetical protein